MWRERSPWESLQPTAKKCRVSIYESKRGGIVKQASATFIVDGCPRTAASFTIGE